MPVHSRLALPLRRKGSCTNARGKALSCGGGTGLGRDWERRGEWKRRPRVNICCGQSDKGRSHYGNQCPQHPHLFEPHPQPEAWTGHVTLRDSLLPYVCASKPPERLGAKPRVLGYASQSITRKDGLGGALRPQTDFIERKMLCCLAATNEISP